MQEENKYIVNEAEVEYEDLNGGVIMEKPFDPTLIKIETKTQKVIFKEKTIYGIKPNRVG